MRVLISASTFPVREGDGLPRFVYDLAQALAKFTDVTALVPDAPGAAQRERMGDVDVRRFTYFLPRSAQALAYGHGIRANMRGSWRAKLQPLPFVFCQALATRLLIRKEQIDLVNSHWMIPQGFSTALVHRAGRNFRHVLTVHAGDIYMLEALPFGRVLANFIVSHCDFVFTVGTHVRESLDALLGRPSKATLQPMGANVSLFRDGAGEPSAEARFPAGYLLFVGRFSEKKGTVYAIRALPRVLERHPDLGLVVIGYGEFEKELR